MSALKRLGRVRSEGVRTQDVTKAYADLETRLKVGLLRTMSGSFASLIALFSGLLPWLVAFYLAFRLVRWRLRHRG